MKDARLYKRIPCDGTGNLVVGEHELDVNALNLSKGGVCMKLAEDAWKDLGLDDLDQVAGQLTVDGDQFHFKARICWSNLAKGMVFFGVEFLEHDDHVINQVLERLSVIDDPPPGDTFNI